MINIFIKNYSFFLICIIILIGGNTIAKNRNNSNLKNIITVVQKELHLLDKKDKKSIIEYKELWVDPQIQVYEGYVAAEFLLNKIIGSKRISENEIEIVVYINVKSKKTGKVFHSKYNYNFRRIKGIWKIYNKIHIPTLESPDQDGYHKDEDGRIVGGFGDAASSHFNYDKIKINQSKYNFNKEWGRF